MSEVDEKEDFVPAEKPDKKERKKWRIRQNGRWFKIDKKCIKEADILRPFYGTTYFDSESLNIRRTSILKMALRFCKKRGEIKTNYAHDENLLQIKLKDFDSEFLQQMKDNHHDDDLIDLIDAAGKLGIKSLFNLLFEDVANIIITRKTPQDIEKIFKIRCKNDADDEAITILMSSARWPLEKDVV